MTQSIWSIEAKEAKPTLPHLLLSTMAMTRLAYATQSLLTTTSSLLTSVSPSSRVRPLAPKKPFWKLNCLRNSLPPRPVKDAESRRKKPPGIKTVTPGASRRAIAMTRPLVITVNSRRPLIWSASASAVVLASAAIASPSSTIAAAAAAMCCFCEEYNRRRTSKESSKSVRSEPIAPPWVRIRRACAARASKSERMVACDRSNRSLKAATDTRPSRSSKVMICSRRS